MDTSVTKNNDLIGAKFRTPALTKAHGRILAYLVSQVHSRNDKSFDYIEILPIKYRELTGNSSYNIRQIEWDLSELTSLTCIVRSPKVTAFCHLVDFASYDKGTGLVKMRLGEEMKPYLLQLHSNYTMYSLEEFLQLKSKHSQRIYELYQKEKNQDKVIKIKYSLNDFKEVLGLVKYKNKGEDIEHLYPLWVNFDRRVLTPARAELCEIGILFDYEPVLRGRKTIGIELIFNASASNLEEQTFGDYSLVQNMPISAIDKIDISRTRSRNEIERAIVQSMADGNYKPLEALAPKSRKERVSLFAKKIALHKKKLKNNDYLKFDLNDLT